LYLLWNNFHYQVGLPFESVLQNSRRFRYQSFACGKDEKGECVIKVPAVRNLGSVQAYSAGNMITIQASKLPRKANIMGMIATNESKSSTIPNPELYTECNYEYIKFGQTVKKSLKAVYSGIRELK